jgi:hypothetical protein
MSFTKFSDVWWRFTDNFCEKYIGDILGQAQIQAFNPDFNFMDYTKGTRMTNLLRKVRI